MSVQMEVWRHGLLQLVLQHARAYADNVDPAKTEAAYVAICDYLRTTPEGYRLVPVKPTPGKLMSMAIRDDHGLGMPGHYDHSFFSGTTHAQRLAAAIARARQAHEEVVGVGFYRESKEQEYANLLAASQKSENAA